MLILKKKMNINDINNNNNFHNNPNNKEDDEEKIAFITKDKLKEYIQKSKIVNRNYIFSIFILYSITIIIIGIKFIFAKTNFSFASYLTLGLINVEEIKSDIYIGSIIALSQCLRNDNELVGFNSLPLQLTIKSQDLMAHINGFEKQLKLAHNNNLLSNILDLLYKNITVYNLNADWSQKIYESYLLKELNYFSFLLNEQAFQNPANNKCNFTNNFYILFFKSDEDIYNLNKEGTTSNQRLIFYILNNLLYNINPILSDILENIIYVQVKTMNNYLLKILILSIILGIIIILIEIIILVKNKLDINFIREIFVYLYHFEENNFQFEYEIYYLDIIAKEFNINSLILLESIKKSNHQNLTSFNINNSLVDEHNNDKDNIKESLINNLNKNNNKFSESLISKYPKKGNDLDQSSINGNPANSSMMHLLNMNNKDATNKLKNDKPKGNKLSSKKNKNKKHIKNEIKNNIILDKDKNEYKENEDTLEIIKTNNKIIPFSIRISITISAFCFLFFMLTLTLNIYDIYKKKNIWEYAVNLSMNYLNKIPKVVEIGLSTILTIIIGKLDIGIYYSKEEYKNHQQKFMVYFTRKKNYEESELISSNIKDSYFSNILNDNYRIRKNIEYCQNDKFFKGYFSLTKNMNKKLAEKNFCISTSYETVHFYNEQMTSLYEFFSKAETLAISCYNENEKLNESGLDLEIDLILYELTKLYLEFEDRMKTDIDKARQLFFQNDDFSRILKDMNIPFSMGISALFGTVKVDMDNLISFISFYEIFFISLSFVLEILFLLYLMFIIFLIEKSKKILFYIAKILKKINY